MDRRSPLRRSRRVAAATALHTPGLTARAPLAMAFSRRYPERPDFDSLERYETGIARLVGVAPDPVA